MGREEASCPCKYKKRRRLRLWVGNPNQLGLQQQHSIWDFLPQYNAISLAYLNRINAIRAKKDHVINQGNEERSFPVLLIPSLKFLNLIY